jgi:hypothetical protein
VRIDDPVSALCAPASRPPDADEFWELSCTEINEGQGRIGTDNYPSVGFSRQRQFITVKQNLGNYFTKKGCGPDTCGHNLLRGGSVLELLNSTLDSTTESGISFRDVRGRFVQFAEGC